MPWQPSFEGERPTLGWLVLQWIEDYLVVPDGPTAGEALTFTREQAAFVLALYEVDPTFEGPPIRGRSLVNGRMVRRAVLSRPKGWGKSPLVAGLCLAEALAPVVLDGWDAAGQPVGREWTSLGFKASVQIIATSEDQTTNTWEPCLEMARSGPVFDEFDIDPMETFIAVPRGKIEAATSAGVSREGFRPVFTAMDQTESWTPSNGGRKLAATIRRNLGKVNGCSVETPNAFEPGVGSVAEESFAAVAAQDEGRTRIASGMLFDHREAPATTDPKDEASLREGLSHVYGDSADTNGGWVSLDRVVAEYWDPGTDPQDARRFYLNQITHASDSWLSAPEWRACKADTEVSPLAPDDVVVLGFDGSRHRSHSVTDATALVGCRVSDGHLFQVRVWEQPDGPDGDDWVIPVDEVDAEIGSCFDRYRVVGFYADPSLWETYVAAWEAKYHRKLRVKASAQHPVEWRFTPSKIIAATRQFHSAVVDGELTHDGAGALTRHVLNARRRTSKGGIQISKEHPESPRKIDAAIAAILAWQCRLDAVSKGVGSRRSTGGRVVVMV